MQEPLGDHHQEEHGSAPGGADAARRAPGDHAAAPQTWGWGACCDVTGHTPPDRRGRGGNLGAVTLPPPHARSLSARLGACPGPTVGRASGSRLPSGCFLGFGAVGSVVGGRVNPLGRSCGKYVPLRTARSAYSVPQPHPVSVLFPGPWPSCGDSGSDVVVTGLRSLPYPQSPGAWAPVPFAGCF